MSDLHGTFEITIRRATRPDLPAVRDCLAAAFESYRADYSEDMFNNTVPTVAGLEARSLEMVILVATVSDAEVVGTIAAAVAEPGIGHLRGMAVTPAFHGQGIAAQLLQTAEAELRRLGCVSVTLDTTAPLHRAMAFYEKQGYRRSGARHPMLGMELLEFRKNL